MIEYAAGENKWIPEPPEKSPEEVCRVCRDNGENVIGRLEVLRKEPYIDAFFFYTEPDCPTVLSRRFVFHEDYRWPADDEDFFDRRVVHGSAFVFRPADLDRIYTLYSAKHPEWKLNRYHTRDMTLLDHIYHCMRKNTAKEMLYKAGLTHLARDVYQIDELNLLAARPSDIYDGIPVRTLRALDCPAGAVLLSDKKRRTFIGRMCSSFPRHFQDRLNDAQCLYLRRLIDGDLTVYEAGRLFGARKDKLRWIWDTGSLFSVFLQQTLDPEMDRARLSEIDPIYRKRLTDRGTDFPMYQDLVRYLLRDRKETDRLIRCSNRRRDDSWQERGPKYVVRYPQTINDLCREAVYMDNCLLAYTDAFIENDTTLLFIRKADDYRTPFITAEIFGNDLMQAYHRFNTDCTPEEAEWIRAYCRRHNISCSHFQFDKAVDLQWQ